MFCFLLNVSPLIRKPEKSDSKRCKLLAIFCNYFNPKPNLLMRRWKRKSRQASQQPIHNHIASNPEDLIIWPITEMQTKKAKLTAKHNQHRSKASTFQTWFYNLTAEDKRKALPLSFSRGKNRILDDEQSVLAQPKKLNLPSCQRSSSSGSFTHTAENSFAVSSSPSLSLISAFHSALPLWLSILLAPLSIPTGLFFWNASRQLYSLLFSPIFLPPLLCSSQPSFNRPFYLSFLPRILLSSPFSPPRKLSRLSLVF